MYQPRIQKVRDLLEEKQLDAMIVSSVSNIFYLTGIAHFSKEEREAYMVITKQNSYFLPTSLYMEEVKKNTTGFIYHEIGRDQPFVKLFKNICVEENLQRIGFEEHDIRYFEYHWISKVIKDLSPLSLEIRIKKDTKEIQSIQNACDMGDKAFAHALQKLHEGVSEKDIEIAIELFLKEHRADISFRSIVAFGGNASMPHHQSLHTRKLKRGDCVLIDMGAKVEGYCSDMTRTVFFGQPTDEAKKIYTTVMESQKKAIEYIQEILRNTQGERTIIARDVDAIAREYIINQEYPSIPHSLGHGIGIEVHEPPRLNLQSQKNLTEGMVFSIEPGIYVPDVLGVRIEDLFAIEDNKLRILTLSPKELLVL